MLKKKSKVSENFKSCRKSQKLPKIAKVAENLKSCRNVAEQLLAKPTIVPLNH